jgi:hypothetical protein
MMQKKIFLFRLTAFNFFWLSDEKKQDRLQKKRGSAAPEKRNSWGSSKKRRASARQPFHTPIPLYSANAWLYCC